jgi:hypothetical protein
MGAYVCCAAKWPIGLGGDSRGGNKYKLEI